MTRYLLSVYQPQGTPDAAELERVMADVAALNREMREAGVWVFAGGLRPPVTASVFRADGEEVLRTDGPFAEAKEFLGGFTIIDVPDQGTAEEWARRTAVAVTLPIELRAFEQDFPGDV